MLLDPEINYIDNDKCRGYLLQYYLKYYSYENLFDNRTTEYFADIARFKSYAKMDGTLGVDSWVPYKSTLFRFFDYYASKNDYRTFSRSDHEVLSRIRPEDLIDYLNHLSKKLRSGNNFSKQTVKNNASHLSSFFKTLSEHSYVNNEYFSQGRDFILAKFADTPKMKTENYVDEKRFKEALLYLYSLLIFLNKSTVSITPLFLHEISNCLQIVSYNFSACPLKA